MTFFLYGLLPSIFSNNKSTAALARYSVDNFTVVNDGKSALASPEQPANILLNTLVPPTVVNDDKSTPVKPEQLTETEISKKEEKPKGFVF